MKEFIQFLKNYGVVGLAIAVIIGGKLNELVNTIVNDLVLPLILNPVLKIAQIENVREWTVNGIFVGKVLGSFIEFLVVALIVFLFSKKVLKEEIVSKK